MNHFIPIGKHMPLSGAQKSAILFLCLGEDRGGNLMQKLSEPEIKKITDAITSMGEIDSETVEETLEEFGEKLGDGGGVFGSIDSAKHLVSQFLPEDRGDAILGEISSRETTDVWAELSNLDDRVLVDFLRREQNQTVAVILSKINPDVAAKILPMLGDDRIPDLVERVIDMESLSAESLHMIEQTIKRDVLSSGSNQAEARTEKQLVSIFNKLDEDVFGALSRELEERVPDQFRSIKQKMFLFDDIAALDDTMLAKVMREVTGNTLPMALRGAKKDIRERFLNAMPSRSRGMLQEEMEAMGPVKARDVKAAQSEMVETTLRMAADGEIELPDDDEQML